MAFRIIPLPKPKQKFIHATCHFLSTICISLGFAAVYVGNNEKSKNADHIFYTNFTSLHSFLGLSAIILYGQNYLLGILHFLVPSVSVEHRKSYMPNHVFLGTLSFVVAAMAAETGIMELTAELPAGCYYDVTEPDVNPAENYHLLPAGCRLGNGIGIMILITVILVLYTLIAQPIVSEDNKAENERLISSRDSKEVRYSGPSP